MSDAPENPGSRILFLKDEYENGSLKFCIVRDIGFLNCSKIEGRLK